MHPPYAEIVKRIKMLSKFAMFETLPSINRYPCYLLNLIIAGR